MPWQEDDEHNQRLLEALDLIEKEKGGFTRLAGAINKDARAKETARARSGDRHKRKHNLIHESTIDRWWKEGLKRVIGANSLNKRIVYEFLERSADFKTELFRPDGQLPPGLLSYVAAHAERLSQPFAKELSKLDGAFELYRPAWTTPDKRDRVLVSRLLFTTENGFTRFREEQDYTDPEYHDTQVLETDEGSVFFTAANIILFGFGLNTERVKLYAANSWFDQLGGALPVTRLSGAMMGISGRRDNPSFPFVAIRSKTPFEDIETRIVPASELQLDRQSRSILQLES